MVTETNFKSSSCQFRKYRRPLFWSSLVQQCLDIDNTFILGPYKFSVQATVDHHGNSIYCGHYTASVSSVEIHSIVTMIELHNAILLIHVIHQGHKYYCINWEWSVPDQTVENGSLLPPMVPAPLSIPLMTGRGTVTETCGIGSVFPSDDLWIGLDTDTNCTLIYDLFLKVWLMGCATCIYLYWLMGKGIAYGGLPFPSTGCPISDVANIYLIWNICCISYCFYNCPPL